MQSIQCLLELIAAFIQLFICAAGLSKSEREREREWPLKVKYDSENEDNNLCQVLNT